MNSTMNSALGSGQAAIRFGCFLGIFAVMAGWEFIAPYRPRQLSRLHRWSNNLALTAAGNLLNKLAIPITAIGFAELTTQLGWGLLNILNPPGLLAFVLSLSLLDLAIYFQHRLFHVVPLLWRLHRVHHADTEFDVSTALRFHPFEVALSLGIKLATVALIGPPVMAVLVFEIILNGSAMFNHGNICLPQWLELRLRWFVVTPSMHRIHHSVLPCETNSNYGFSLSCWDRLFSSYRQDPTGNPLTMPIGLEAFRSKREAGLGRLLLQPFLNTAAAPTGEGSEQA